MEYLDQTGLDKIAYAFKTYIDNLEKSKDDSSSSGGSTSTEGVMYIIYNGVKKGTTVSLDLAVMPLQLSSTTSAGTATISISDITYTDYYGNLINETSDVCTITATATYTKTGTGTGTWTASLGYSGLSSSYTVEQEMIGDSNGLRYELAQR